MAFDASNLALITNEVSVASSKLAFFIYKTTADADATVVASGYFSDAGQIDDTSAATQESTKNRTQQLEVDSVIYAICSDRSVMIRVTADGSAGAVTTALLDQGTAIS